MGVHSLTKGGSEENFIRSSWLQSQRRWHLYGSKEPSWTPEVSEATKARIERHLQESLFIVAHEVEDPDTILAWICADFPLCHYAYTKAPFRRWGIAKRLWTLAGEPRECTSQGFVFGAIQKRYGLTFKRDLL